MNTNPSGYNPELDAYLNHHAQQADPNAVSWWRMGLYPYSAQIVIHIRIREPGLDPDDPGDWVSMFHEHHNAVDMASSLIFYAEYLQVMAGVDIEKARKDTWDLLGEKLNQRLKEHMDAYRKAHPELD